MSLTTEQANERAQGTLPGAFGIDFTTVQPGKAEARLELRADHMAPNGYLHAASVIALADSCCGFGAWASLPEGATGFTTIELKSNFLGTARAGAIACTAWLVHGGRSTQVWDATVTNEGDARAVAMFRCTQIVLYSR